MDSNAVVWIVVAVVAVLVIAALAFAARSRRNQKRHVEAERIRDDITTHAQRVDKREALADETAARARAAQAEAEAKAAEAARLQDQADSHRDAVVESREDIEERRRHADHIDPKTRVQDEPAEPNKYDADYDTTRSDTAYDQVPRDQVTPAGPDAAARHAATEDVRRR